MLMPMTMSNLDKISSLSDVLLCYILSFLPTIDAVATCLLSKRWTRLWLSVPTLDFNELDVRFNDDKEGHFRFVRMVYAVMLKRDVTYPVKKFCLKGRYRQKSSDVTIWVNTAIQRRVEHLELLFSGTNICAMKLPSGILGSRTLVVLKLSQLMINGGFVGGFPSLKIMQLHSVSFEEHRHLFQLLLGCPTLLQLRVSQLAVDNMFITDGELCLDKLLHAYIHTCFMSDAYIPLEWICRVKFLHLHLSLSYPKYKTGCTFHNLTCLKIFVLQYKWGWLLEVLKHCPKLQIFEIQHDKNILLPEDKEWVHPQFFPECFSSHLETCSFINYGGYECELQFAKYIMQNAKVLCTMRICSNTFSNTLAKHEMLKALSLCPRSSMTCKLSFE